MRSYLLDLQNIKRKMMIIKMAGANGYLGNNVTSELKKNGHTVFNINRELLYGPVNELQKELTGANVVYFLAGAPILQRWTEKNKRVILDAQSQQDYTEYTQQ